ncbi:uncharacterized protein LOC109267936 [Panthera pardus]|uniref:Uncharacterized protein LOC109267936 n=1 Tax=Panthera pardus TaxID=9691 RepID=A0A9V1FPH0_PANPR|nr:uncharacterized protein LOC109267936 [Panthera pardus]XP_053753372.1 uncharacterized protein LOC109267936 [Panthera pardus]
MCRWRQEAVGRPGHPRPSRVPGGARSLLRPGEDRPWGQRRGDGVAAGGGVPAAADRVSSSRRCLGEVTPLTPLLPGRRRPPPRFHRKPLRNPPSVPGGLGPPFRRLIAAGEYLPGRLAGGQLWMPDPEGGVESGSRLRLSADLGSASSVHVRTLTTPASRTHSVSCFCGPVSKALTELWPIFRCSSSSQPWDIEGSASLWGREQCVSHRNPKMQEP